MKKLIAPIILLALAVAAYFHFTGKDVPDVEEVKKKAGEIVDKAKTAIEARMKKNVVTVHSEDEVMNVAEPTVNEMKHHFWKQTDGPFVYVISEPIYYAMMFGTSVTIESPYKQVVSSTDQTESADGKAYIYTSKGQKTCLEIVAIKDDVVTVKDGGENYTDRRVKGEEAQKYQKILDEYLAAKKAQG